MKNSKIAALHVLILLFSNICINAAQAAAISNLSTNAQNVLVSIGDESQQTITIAPNETWRTPGKIFTDYKGQKARLEEGDEYAIWQNGDFGPQRKSSTNSPVGVGR